MGKPNEQQSGPFDMQKWAVAQRANILTYWRPEVGRHWLEMDITTPPKEKWEGTAQKFWDFRCMIDGKECILHQKEDTSFCKYVFMLLAGGHFNFWVVVSKENGDVRIKAELGEQNGVLHPGSAGEE